MGPALVAGVDSSAPQTGLRRATATQVAAASGGKPAEVARLAQADGRERRRSARRHGVDPASLGGALSGQL